MIFELILAIKNFFLKNFNLLIRLMTKKLAIIHF